jgi:hypothetical protein
MLEKPEQPAQPRLTVVTIGATGVPPPRNLGEPGLALWNRIQGEYRIEDCGGQELLLQACEASDRLAGLNAQIEQDGATIRSRNTIRAHPLLREEIGLRSFVVRTLQRLGITSEPLKAVGHPPTRKW